MDRRTILFIAISVAIVVLYQEIVLRRLTPPPQAPLPPEPTIVLERGSNPPPLPGATTAAKSPTEGAGTEPQIAAANGESPSTEPLPVGEGIAVETDLYRAVFTTLGGRLESFTLKKYRATPAADSPGLALVQPAPGFDPPLGVELRGASVWTDARSLYTADKKELQITGGDQGTIELRTAIGNQALVKRLTFHGDRYVVDLRVDLPHGEALPAKLNEPASGGQPASTALVLTRHMSVNPKSGFGAAPFEGAAALVNNKLVQRAVKNLTQPERLDGQVGWAGNEDHYFLNAAAPDRGNSVILRADGEVVESRILSTRSATAPEPINYTLYFGPKQEQALEDAGHDFQRALNLGWFGPISLFLLRILTLSHRVTRNYGIDIILLTVLVKIAFLPLTQKSFQSMRQMQKLQPEMTRLREKYKDDSKQMNTEIMELYRRHKVNPLGGCLPMVLQIPVFFGLYQALANTIQLRHAPFALWVQDLAAPERLEMFGYGVPVLTILLGVTMFVQQRMAPQTGDPAQQRLMMFMPLVFTFMFIGFPAGLTLYWLTNNVLTIAQQYYILRKAPS